MSTPTSPRPASQPPLARPSFALGLTGFVIICLLGLLSGLGGAVMMAGLYLLPTALYHLVRGRSWLTPLVPSSRVLAGVVGIPLALVSTVAGASAAPGRASAPATRATHATATPGAPGASASSAAATTTATAATTPSASPTPTSSESLPNVDPNVAYATALGSEVPSAPATVSAGTNALEVLASIPIKGRAPQTGYARAVFGQEWYDLDRNGCDTRNDILRRDLVDQTIKAGTHGCVVAAGTLHDPYTAQTIAFIRGQDTSNAVEIDHVVALGDAWQTGAQQLTIGQRTSFANDPLNLLAVDGPTNVQKGDADAASWLPPNKDYRCAYVARQTAVKAKYRLWMTQAEHDAIAQILAACPDEPVPTSDVPALVDDPAPATSAPVAQASATTVPVPAAQAAPATQSGPAAQTTTQDQGGSVYYANCAAVRAAGKAPLYRGQPGYRSGLDRDHDGVACET